jgi:branched-chain amino acid transport system ATP-binding protein
VTALLAVDNVTQRFGSLVAVNGVSMLVERGELRAVIGPNGAGKTTFFNLISGLIVPTSGKIYFDGKDVTDLLPARRVALGMARTFQITEIFPELSVHENLRIPVEVSSGQRLRMWASKRKDAEIRERVDQLLGLAGLRPRANRLVGELSHGDQRATEILMALALEPRLLLLDEPTAGMSDQETYGIAELIRQLHLEQHLTILLVEHDMRVISHLADRITVLAEGAPLAEGTFAEICGDERVQTAYLGGAG